MLKYVVVAVFSILILPCFAVAQDCGCGGGSVIDGGSFVDAPVIDHGMDAGISDCGCDAAPAPAGPSCGCGGGGRLRGMVGGLRGRVGGRLGGGGCGCGGGLGSRLGGMAGRLGGGGGCGGGCGAAPVSDCGCGG